MSIGSKNFYTLLDNTNTLKVGASRWLVFIDFPRRKFWGRRLESILTFRNHSAKGDVKRPAQIEVLG